jgi:putative membrane protein
MGATTVLNSMIAVASLALATAALGQPDADTSKFLADTIRSNLAEVKMGELAQQRGDSDDVRDFGKMLATDHGMGVQKSSALAKTLGVTPPAEPSADAKMTYEALAKVSGKEFDRQFAMHMVMAHEKNIAEYRKQAGAGNSQVAAFAKETLPTLEKHLQTAQSIGKEHGGH